MYSRSHGRSGLPSALTSGDQTKKLNEPDQVVVCLCCYLAKSTSAISSVYMVYLLLLSYSGCTHSPEPELTPPSDDDDHDYYYSCARSAEATAAHLWEDPLGQLRSDFCIDRLHHRINSRVTWSSSTTIVQNSDQLKMGGCSVPLMVVSSLVLPWLFLIQITSANPINATYDQRQNGKVNVHISIKDVAIILQSESALGGGDEDINYDYDYDYDHLTVKPNGIWATLGATTAASAVPPAIPGNAPPTPAAPLSPGFGVDHPNVTQAVENATVLENPEPELSFIQFPQTEEEKPQPPLETISQESHPFQDWPSTSAAGSTPGAVLTNEASTTDTSIVKITTKKPGNRTTHKYAWNGDLEEIPVEVIIEPVLKNKQRQHVVPGMSSHRDRPQRKFGRYPEKPPNKFGL